MRPIEFYANLRNSHRFVLKDGLVHCKCTTCEEWKPRTSAHYHGNKAFADNMNTRCIPCFKKHRKQSLLKHPETMRNYARANKVAIRKWKIGYVKQNRSTIKAKLQVYYRKNVDIVKEKSRQFRLNNPEYSRQYTINRYRTNPEFRLIMIHRSRCRKAAVLGGAKKAQSYIKSLGCTAAEFRTHLEKQFVEGMSWDNHTSTGWHIDHIKPLSTFDLSIPEEQKRAFHYTNTQPMWWYDNLAKGNRVTPQNRTESLEAPPALQSSEILDTLL